MGIQSLCCCLRNCRGIGQRIGRSCGKCLNHSRRSETIRRHNFHSADTASLHIMVRLDGGRNRNQCFRLDYNFLPNRCRLGMTWSPRILWIKIRNSGSGGSGIFWPPLTRNNIGRRDHSGFKSESSADSDDSGIIRRPLARNDIGRRNHSGFIGLTRNNLTCRPGMTWSPRLGMNSTKSESRADSGGGDSGIFRRPLARNNIGRRNHSGFSGLTRNNLTILQVLGATFVRV